jgi:prolycopene isomerase
VASRDEAGQDTYDVVVIGSGIAGVTAAALLAKSGRRVLIVEQGEGPGGYAHAFKRGPYTFDPAIHVIGQAAPGLLPDAVFRHLGVQDRLRFHLIEPFYELAFPDGYRFRAPFGIEEYIGAHAREFPNEADGFRRFFELATKVHWEAHQLPTQLGLRDLDGAVEQFPTLFKYMRATFDDALDESVSDPRLKAVASGLWPYMGSPPSRLSFVNLSQVLATHVHGVYYCEGSFQNLVDTFIFALEQNGGELLLNKRVAKIPVVDGHVTGVILDDGRRIQAPVVISNADARATFLDMVGEEHLPSSFVRRLKRLVVSMSAFVVFAATTLDLRQADAAHETFLYKHWDHEETYRDQLAGRVGGMWINVPTITDPSLAPAGEHIAIVTALVPYDIGVPWTDVRERFAEQLLDEFEPMYPGLRKSLTFMETATPLTLERYALNYHGATYGWENLPDQVASKRITHVPPVAGLYLAGHWSQPGTGSLRVLVSGIHAAQIVMGAAGETLDIRPTDALAPAFRPA